MMAHSSFARIHTEATGMRTSSGSKARSWPSREWGGWLVASDSSWHLPCRRWSGHMVAGGVRSI